MQLTAVCFYPLLWHCHLCLDSVSLKGAFFFLSNINTGCYLEYRLIILCFISGKKKITLLFVHFHAQHDAKSGLFRLVVVQFGDLNITMHRCGKNNGLWT